MAVIFVQILVSALLLICAFPPFHLSPLALIALIPVLRLIDGVPAKSAFRRGFALGIVFYAGMVYWFVNMAYTAQIPLILSVAAYLLMVIYLALYYGLFAWCVKKVSLWALPLRLAVVPSVWVVLEFIRDHFCGGFGWMKLGHVFYKTPELIQIADITGVYGISFFVVLVNVVLKELYGMARQARKPGRHEYCAAAVLLVVTGVVLGYGLMKLKQSPEAGPSFKVAVIQGNVPQNEKWSPEQWPAILAKYKTMTLAAKQQRPDLIVWPETSFPGYLWDDEELFNKLQMMIDRIDIPVLLGAVIQNKQDFYNATMLLGDDGQIVGEHHKIHLVPFGEYIPLRRQIPLLGALIPVGDFTSGTVWTRFEWPLPHRPSGPGGSFATLVCFEDTVARVTRQFVREGAGLLINMTNDAWFADSKEPQLHLQAAVFRTVENRRYLVRAANTGVSAVIDPFGQIKAVVAGDRGKQTFVDGFFVENVAFLRQKTFYTKFGDVFTYCCFGCILGCVLIKMRRV